MIDFNSFGTISVFIVIGLYTLITMYKELFVSDKSLRNYEKVHRFLLVIGGIIIGFAFGTQQIQFSEIEIFSEDFILALLFLLGGFFSIIFGNVFLKNSLWKPLENISEYSSEFGTNFLATRLPETGGLELERFAARFNSNVINLANDISILEIRVDKVTEAVDSTISTGKDLTSTTSSLSDIALEYNNLTKNQSGVINEIGSQVGEFASWYGDTQEKLQENFIELRSLSEMGNLIAINAAVEASNLDEPNPGFETLAAKLRDLARSLEERQEALRKILSEISMTYEEFRHSIQSNINRAVGFSQNTSNLGDKVDSVIQEIGQKEVTFIDSYKELEKSIKNFKENIPTAYL